MTSDRDREHAERTARIERLLREGAPFDRIFPALKREQAPPSVFADGHADFVAMDIDSPHGGTTMRSYILDCQHATAELSLAEFTKDRDGEALAQMLPTLRSRAADAGLLCLCWPKGWAAA